MSILEFSKTLRNRASSQVIDRLVSSSVETYRSKNISAASILEQDSKKFRLIGEKQGATRLVVTEDSMAELIRSFNVSVPDDKTVIDLYLQYLQDTVPEYKNKHFEFYDSNGNLVKSNNTNTPLGKYIPSVSGKGIIAVRGLNFSHDHTLTHMTRFLRYAGALTNISEQEAKKAVSELYERGHIIATTTGRQLYSIGGISAEQDVLDKIVQLSIDLDIASSSLSKPKYANVLANINKDFTGKRAFMNIEFQVKRSESGTGNRDAGYITAGLRAISTLRKLIDNVQFTSRGKLATKPIATNHKISEKVFLDLLNKIEKYESSILTILGNYIEDAPKYVADLKSSRSAKEHVIYTILDILRGVPPKPTKVAHKNVSVATIKTPVSKSTDLKSKVKPLVDKRKKELENLKKIGGTLKPVARARISMASLEAILRSKLALAIKENMGTGNEKRILNYRSGRFANTASITRATLSREGMVTVFYDYMRYPYATFSSGGRQEYPKSRDPKLLISKSIRDIGASLVNNKMRAVLV